MFELSKEFSFGPLTLILKGFTGWFAFNNSCKERVNVPVVTPHNLLKGLECLLFSSIRTI